MREGGSLFIRSLMTVTVLEPARPAAAGMVTCGRDPASFRPLSGEFRLWHGRSCGGHTKHLAAQSHTIHVPSANVGDILKACDAAALGIVVPMVQSVKEARNSV